MAFVSYLTKVPKCPEVKNSVKYQMKFILLLGLAFSSLMGLERSYAEPDTVLEVGKFSAAQEHGSLPPGWKPLQFRKIKEHTQYFLVNNGDGVVIKAVSQGSASGLVREISIDPKKYPIVKWRWKVENILEKGDVSRKEGDDYPARLYITFEYDRSKVGFFDQAKYEAAKLIHGQYPPIATINYIWANKAPVGAIVPNPYTDHAQMIVTQSGTSNLNEWVTEERNILQDYQEAFGDAPSMISGIAIMSDTDNTQESVVAYFGDIVFQQEHTKKSK